MNITVVHHSLNPAGGAEKLCVAAIEALKMQKHQVVLVTVERTNWDHIHKIFGKIVKPDKEVYITPRLLSRRLNTLSIALTYSLAYILQLWRSRSKHECDLTINTFGDIMNSFSDVTYIHFPLRAALEFSQIPAFIHTSIWQGLGPLYNLTALACERIAPSRLLITNSKFMQDIIRTTLNRKAIVIYPPVDTNVFLSECFKPKKDGNLVAVVASYTPKRHLEQLPLIAQHTTAARFIVIGKTDKYSTQTMKKLKEDMHLLGVEDKIVLLRNVPFTRLLKTLSDAKVYLHVMPFDHFGISVVEAMASGCVPVVHRSGGPWTDILDKRQGEFGFSYSTPAEAADYIDRLVTDEGLRNGIATKASNRSKKFDRSVFMRRMAEVVERVAG